MRLILLIMCTIFMTGCFPRSKTAYICDVYGDPIKDAKVSGEPILGSITRPVKRTYFGRTDENGKIKVKQLNTLGDLGTLLVVECDGYNEETKNEIFNDDAHIIIVMWKPSHGTKPNKHKTIKIFP